MGKSNDLFGQILSHGPSQSTIFLVLTKMKEEGRTSEVIQECLKALSNYPDDIQLKMLLAETYLAAGLIGQAEAELQRVASGISSLIPAYKLQAKIYAKQQRVEEAFEALKRYLAHNPDDQEALDLLEAIKPAEEKAAITPVEEEPVAEAQVHSEDAARTAAEDISVDVATPTLAEIFYSQGQIHEAISTYEKILLNDPGDKASIKRLVELKASITEEAEPQLSDDDNTRAKEEKMIAVLEGWLANIQALNHV
jgi:tetratricopeptide (TPR) repeat protein